MTDNDKVTLFASIFLILAFASTVWSGIRRPRRNRARIFLVWSGLLSLGALMITVGILDLSHYSASTTVVSEREFVSDLRDDFSITAVLHVFAIVATFLCWQYWTQDDT